MFMLSDFAAAIKMLRNSFELHPNFIPSGLYLAASYALAGNERKAAATAAQIKRINPAYRLADDHRAQFKDPEVRDRLIAALRKAGLS